MGVAGVALIVVFLLGPRVRFQDGWNEPVLPGNLDAYLSEAESDVQGLRVGDGKSIEWVDPDTRAATPLSLVYLHGFTADRHEVEPLVTDLSRDLGANVYFTRLRGHGRDGTAMGEATVEAWLDDAAEAVAIGGRIGERVVLVGTSTGGTLALWAATRPEARARVAAVVLISPNLGVQDSAAPLVLWPWGGAIVRVVIGDERCYRPKNAEQERHWTTCHDSSALLPMMALVDHVRGLPDGALEVPTLVLYATGDQVVDPDETREVITRIGTESTELRVIVGSGDPEQHVIAGEVMSPETTDVVRREILEFLSDELGPM